MNDTRNKASRSDWHNLKPMPDEVESMQINRDFAPEEYDKLSYGLISRSMDEKWFAFLEGNELYFHRSWRGQCIYQLKLAETESGYRVAEATVNRNPEQYKETDLRYDERLLNFLIENFLLGNKVPFPIRQDDADSYPSGVVQHGFSGSGYPEVLVEKEEH